MAKILVKFPSRGRAEKFMSTLHGYINLSNDKSIQYLISIDNDDIMMQDMEERFKNEKNILVYSGVSIDKVHAINRDLHRVPRWDILVLASDDMICQQQGWDDILKKEMEEYFPDTDGVLFHNDGYLKSTLNTMVIMGRKYFNRFNYIYHPSYKSLWADNEFTDVAFALGKQKYFDKVLFKHEHFSNNRSVPQDQLMKKNESFYHSDKITFNKRKSINFGL